MSNRLVLYLTLAVSTLSCALRTDAADNIAPTVMSILPPAGVVVTRLRTVEVLFSEDVQGVDAGDLLLNGIPATNAVLVTPNQFKFEFPQPPTGAVQVAWAAGNGITDEAVPPNPFAGGSWSYVLDPGRSLFDLRINE